MESRERPTMFERLLEMVRGRGSVTNDRPEPGVRKAGRDKSRIVRKAGRKRKKAASAS